MVTPFLLYFHYSILEEEEVDYGLAFNLPKAPNT